MAIPPPYVQLPWRGQLPDKSIDVESLPPHSRGFLLLKPLYGGEDSPMRCCVTLAKRLRMANLRQLKTDVCIFPRLSPIYSLIDGLLIIHVDDIMITGAPQLIRDAAQITTTFKTGAVGEFPTDHGIAYLGLQLRRAKDGTAHLAQSEYIRDAIRMGIEECLSGG